MTLSGQHHLRNIIWRVGIFDEAHRLKNKASKAAEVLQTIQIEHKVLLTGTPIQNSLDELLPTSSTYYHMLVGTCTYHK
jgi:SNF2 family DNA or RNA helicase